MESARDEPVTGSEQYLFVPGMWAHRGNLGPLKRWERVGNRTEKPSLLG